MKLFGVTRKRARELEEFFKKHGYKVYLEYVDGLVYDIAISRSVPAELFFDQKGERVVVSFHDCEDVFDFYLKDFFKIEIM